MEHNFLTADTGMPPNMPYPRFLADMEIGSTAKELYIRLLDKAVTEKETDSRGYFYTRFPIHEQMAALSKSDATVKRAMLELERAGLLVMKRQGHGRTNLLYPLL